MHVHLANKHKIGIPTHTYMCIYIYRERDTQRDREREREIGRHIDRSERTTRTTRRTPMVEVPSPSSRPSLPMPGQRGSASGLRA